jgi:hypothetical protein
MDHNSKQHVSLEVNVKSFKKCYVSNAVNKTDNDMLWNGIEEDGDIRSEECGRW